MTLFAFASLSVALCCFILAAFVFITGKSRLHRTWAAFNMVVGLWSLGTFYAAISKISTQALLSWKLSYLPCTFISIAFYHVVHVFCDFKKIDKTFISIYAEGVIFFFIILFTRLFINSSIFVFNAFYYNKATFIFAFWLFLWGLVTFLAFYKLRTFIKSTKGIKRTQALYLFWGMILGFAGGTASVLPAFGIMIYPAWHFSICIYFAIMTYAILRHQLTEIEIIIRRAVVFAGLFAGVYGILTFFTFLTQDVFYTLTGGNRWFTLTPSILIITLALKPLENLLIKTTDKFLFQKKYDYRELLRTFTSEVLEVLDIDKLTHLTAEKLSSIIRTRSCGVLLLNRAKNRFDLSASVGIAARNAVFNMDNTLVAFLDRTKLYLSVKDQGKDSRLPDRILYDMNNLKLELAIPLMIHEEMIGILTLGRKKSDEDYTQEDMDILLALSRALSIAINNAEMFDELGKTQAEAAQREKMAVIGTLAAGINHEICNPLGIARGQCEVFLLNAREGLYKKRPKEEQIYEAMKIMEKVIKETDRATAITKKLSTFAKPGSGDLNQAVSITHEIDEIMALVGHELKMENIKVIKDIPEDLPQIKADRKQIQEIFFNLIRNAGQAINENGSIAIKARRIDGKIRTELEDTGHGIPPDKLEQIFNPFYTTKVPGKGTGLGLFIVKQIVQRNKGTISVKSTVGKGTIFTLEFPVLQLKEKSKDEKNKDSDNRRRA